MEASAIRDAVRAVPFQSVRLHLADGRALLIPHPDFVFVAPNGRRMIVVNPDDSMAIIEPLLIVSLEFVSGGFMTSADKTPNDKGDNGAS